MASRMQSRNFKRKRRRGLDEECWRTDVPPLRGSSFWGHLPSADALGSIISRLRRFERAPCRSGGFKENAFRRHGGVNILGIIRRYPEDSQGLTVRRGSATSLRPDIR